MSAASSKGPVFDPGLCRCCGTSGTMRKCRLLTAEYENPNFGKEIFSDMIMDCFGLVLSYLDSKPTERLICANCVCRLRDAVAFRKQVLQCEQAFLQVRMSDKVEEEPVKTTFPSTVVDGRINIEFVKVEPGSPMFADDQDDEDGLMETGTSDDKKNESNKKRGKQTSQKDLATSGIQNTSNTNNNILETDEHKIISESNHSESKALDASEELEDRDMTVDTNLNENVKNIPSPNPLQDQNKSSQIANTAKNYSCDICDYETSNAIFLNNHLKAHAASKRFCCDICSYMTIKKGNLILHIKTHYKQKHLSCNTYKAKFLKPLNLKRHQTIHTRKKHSRVSLKKPLQEYIMRIRTSLDDNDVEQKVVDNNEKPKRNCLSPDDIIIANYETNVPSPNPSAVSFESSHIANTAKYSCDICDYTTSNADILKCHLKAHKSLKRFCCDMCFYIATRKSELISHLIIHTREKPYSCDVCHSRFARRSHLKRHKKTHTGEKPYSCDVCNSRFAQGGSLKKHKRIHTGEKPYSCDVCNSRFAQGSALKKHKRIHTGEKPYCCDLCNSRFSDGSTLKKHKKKHTGEKPYSCDVCNSRFAQGSDLNKHKRIHTGEKPYSCDVCYLRFAQLSHLRRHKKTHTGEKPHSCDICNSRFAEVGNLKIHKRTHTKEKPYSCDVCPSKFAQLSPLKTHMRIHTGEKTYSCDICPSSFAQVRNLKKHKKTHRGKTIFL